jgi:hypothetical protein
MSRTLVARPFPSQAHFLAVKEVAVVFGAFLAAWCGHTPESQRLAGHVDAALTAIGYPPSRRKAASIDMGLDKDGTKLSRQLAGREPLNLWRLSLLPGFPVALAKVVLAEAGATVLSAQEREFVVSLGRLGRRRMAKVLPALFPARRVS